MTKVALIIGLQLIDVQVVILKMMVLGYILGKIFHKLNLVTPKMTKVAQIIGLQFIHVQVVILKKMVSGYILGGSITNSSGHTGSDFRSSRTETDCAISGGKKSCTIQLGCAS
jgi:hypothetical protein